MILSYKRTFPWGGVTLFEQKIAYGLWKAHSGDFKPKKHSLREDISNRWHEGVRIDHAYGVRTKFYHCFIQTMCTGTQSIEIQEIPVAQSDYCYIYRDYIGKEKKEVNKIFRVLIDGKALCKVDIAILAGNDGFDTTHDFFKWFNKPFKGKIIHWTDFRY